MERTQVDSIVNLAADLAGKADQIEEVVVIYTVKDDPNPRAMDNSLTVSQAVYLCELFKSWLLSRINQPKD